MDEEETETQSEMPESGETPETSETEISGGEQPGEQDKHDLAPEQVKSKMDSILKDLHRERKARKEYKAAVEASETLATNQNLRITELESEIMEMKTTSLLQKHGLTEADAEAVRMLPTLEQRAVWAERLAIRQPSGSMLNMGPVQFPSNKPDVIIDDGIPKLKMRHQKN